MKYFVRKGNCFYGEEMKVRQFFRTQKKSLLTEINETIVTRNGKKSLSISCDYDETNIRHLHSLPFVFAADETLHDKILWLHNETRNTISTFWCILKATNLKIRLRDQHPVQGRLTKETQFSSVIRLKINSDYFCFRKREKILQRILWKKTI